MQNHKLLLEKFIPEDQDNYKFQSDENIWIPRVTHILKIIAKGQGFENWLKNKGKEADTLLKDAGDFGSNIHTHLEEIGKGIKINIDALKPKERRCVSSFLDWKEQNVKNFLLTEKTLANKQYLYAGTLDALVELKDGRIAILDYKTSKYIYDTYKLQISAYAKMVDIHIDVGFVLRFEKQDNVNLDLEVKELNNLDEEFEIFLCALRLWYWKNNWSFKKGGK